MKAEAYQPRPRHKGDVRTAPGPHVPRCEAEGCKDYYAFGFDVPGRRTLHYCPAHREIGAREAARLRGGVDGIQLKQKPQHAAQGELL